MTTETAVNIHLCVMRICKHSTKHLPYGNHLELDMDDIVKLNGIITSV